MFRWAVPALGALLVCSAVNASTIYGLDLRGDNEIFRTTTTNFVNDFTNVGGVETYDSFALDFNPLATTLWAVLFSSTDPNVNLQYGTVSLVDGDFTSQGQLSGLADPTANISGMAVDPVSGNWYLSAIEGGVANLYEGDITTGVFNLVGPIGFNLNIDISIDSQGNAYGHDIAADELISINLNTGMGTTIGSTGQPANFAQGMDFDYADDTLYATVYTGGGTGVFGFFNLATGFFNVLEDTTPLNAEMEMVVATPIPGPGVLALIGLAGLVSRRRR
ncbi:MAG: hypothetical protein ACYS0G_12480 [Planctomycetota bacterium]|jgi:MYXO-CTERM domain-containing protein